MRRLKKLFWLIVIVLISNCIIVTPSFAEGEEQNNDTGQNSNIPEPGEIVQDYYDGDYTIEDIISKYNVVTFEDIEKFKHIVGPVLVEGDLGQEGETIYHTHKTDGVNSCIKGEVVANGNTTSSAYTNPTDIKLYVGEENTVEAYRASDNTNRELEVNEHYEATSYTVNGKPYYTQYMAVRTEDYFDFDKLKDNVIEEQANFAEGTTLTKNENNVIYVEAGSTYTIDSLEGVSEIRINNLQLNDNEQTTLINIKDNGEITMPTVTDGNGTQFSTNDYIGGVSNTMNLVWSIPNATKVVFGASAFIGHVIAPNAYVEKLAGNSAGCIICKNIQGEEIHYYPFNGRIEIPKKEKKYAFVSKVDEDSGDEVSDATIEIYDALGTLIDTWTTAGEPHKVENLTAGEIYTIKETTTPQGYTGSSEVKFKVDDNGIVTFDESTPGTLEDGTILIKNKLLKTDVTITKHSETTDGETLSGAEYILYRTNGNTTEYYTGTNEDGYATWSEVESEALKKETQDNGIAKFDGITITKSDTENTTYYFKEVKAPRLYELDSTPIEFTINADDYTAEQAIAHKNQINEKIKVKVNIAKVDEDTNEPVAGAHIQVLDGETIVAEWDTTDDKHEVEGLYPEKEYKIKETVTPQGYKGSTEKTFKLDENGNIIVADTTATYLEDGTIIVKNKIITTSVTITKHSETLDGEKLPDTDYILYRTKTEDGTEKKEYYKGINENGVAEWSENRADATTKTTNNEGIAEFRGITITKSDLDNTNYFFEEVKAPSSYELDSTPVEVMINADNYEAGKAIAGADQANEKITLHVKITKIDEYTNESVVGAHLQVLDEEGNIIDEWDTTTEEHKVKRLVANKKYTLRETIAPQGYTASRDSIFVVNEDGTINRDETDAFITEDGMILVKNKPVTTEIKVTKKDEETGETLEDSQYALYRTKTEDGTIEYYIGKDENGIAMWSGDITKTILMTTNENGNAQFDGITIRKADLEDYEYYVVEKKAPEGYELNSTPIRVKMISSNYMDGVVFEEIEHFNKKIVIPKADPIEEKESVSVKTGDNVSTYIQIVAIALSIIIISSKVEVRFKSKM